MRIFPRKCHICQTRYHWPTDGSVPVSWGYGEKTIHYHVACLVDVLDSPEVYGNDSVDRALVVADALKTQRQETEFDQRRRAEKIAAAKEALWWAEEVTI